MELLCRRDFERYQGKHEPDEKGEFNCGKRLLKRERVWKNLMLKW